MMVFRTVNSMFQHTAARRRLAELPEMPDSPFGFNTQPPEGGWNADMRGSATEPMFQHTAARRRLEAESCRWCPSDSRINTQPPEGGWVCSWGFSFYAYCFNTQPPEGGWCFENYYGISVRRFNTQPPEGGWKFKA